MDVEHIVVHGEDYAVIKKSPKRKKKLPKDISALMSPGAKAHASMNVLNLTERGRNGDSLENRKPQDVVKSKKMDRASGSPSSEEPAWQGFGKGADSAVSQEVQSDYAVVDMSAKKKNSADSSRSPKPARRNQPNTGSPLKNTDKNIMDTNNGQHYASIDTSNQKKSSDTSLTSPMSSSNHQLSPATARKGVVTNEAPDSHRGVVQSDRESTSGAGGKKPRKIEYSTVVFPNSTRGPPDIQTERAVEVRDFDRTKYDYSTVVFQNVSVAGGDENSRVTIGSPGMAKGVPVKKSIYDSDDEGEDSPYVNVRRNGRPASAKKPINTPPIVPPRRGAAAITDDTDHYHT